MSTYDYAALCTASSHSIMQMLSHSEQSRILRRSPVRTAVVELYTARRSSSLVILFKRLSWKISFVSGYVVSSYLLTLLTYLIYWFTLFTFLTLLILLTYLTYFTYLLTLLLFFTFQRRSRPGWSYFASASQVLTDTPNFRSLHSRNQLRDTRSLTWSPQGATCRWLSDSAYLLTNLFTLLNLLTYLLTYILNVAYLLTSV